MKKNILAENMQRFRTKNLSESNKQRLNEQRWVLKNKSTENIAKQMKKSDGGMFGDDKEVRLVIAISSIKDKTQLNDVSKLLPGGIWKFLNGVLTGSEFHKTYGKSSVIKELERIYNMPFWKLAPQLKPQLDVDERWYQEIQRRGTTGGSTTAA